MRRDISKLKRSPAQDAKRADESEAKTEQAVSPKKRERRVRTRSVSGQRNSKKCKPPAENTKSGKPSAHAERAAEAQKCEPKQSAEDAKVLSHKKSWTRRTTFFGWARHGKDKPLIADDFVPRKDAFVDDIELQMRRTVTTPAAPSTVPPHSQIQLSGNLARERKPAFEQPFAEDRAAHVRCDSRNHGSEASEPTAHSGSIFKPLSSASQVSVPEHSNYQPRHSRTISVMIEHLGDARFSDDL
uniref:Uncharacterized protein n=1 Tax=Erythrolobus australicus TaxID=1077150 RepID=A0A7S1XH13_9RHOD|mmetsp:Transcript_1752/g.4659  ORF Transcript_1752/g.4659 Transcript_1752/m.4659 type:complete len:243 (+) Transcript_1752:423-1151(+)|eukprot:CAMPEP_0185837804 /NCGR_PEP_ID=MMETSP1353-20130828/12022_1 /TAXON_ID=1077150 /ORGANISM="Erythrolobus australicus, Strain CCMP3124" /LENGTH=242 /DNA_ID=CAMNT_0028536773 /DNA_START=407 /DNA_END=1135 /DNA_ORIENTATION=+